MRETRDLSSSQKFIVWLFIITLAAAGLFIAVRIARKPTYKAHEKRQCDLLAASTLAIFTRETELSPELWDAFTEDEIVLILDHRAMPGNWNVRLTAARSPANGTIALKAEAASGWNSRSPESSVFYAQLSGERGRGGCLRISFDETVGFISPFPTSPKEEDKTLLFTYPNGKEPPVKIEALVTNFKYSGDEETYTILTLKR